MRCATLWSVFVASSATLDILQPSIFMTVSSLCLQPIFPISHKCKCRRMCLCVRERARQVRQVIRKNRARTTAYVHCSVSFSVSLAIIIIYEQKCLFHSQYDSYWSFSNFFASCYGLVRPMGYNQFPTERKIILGALYLISFEAQQPAQSIQMWKEKKRRKLWIVSVECGSKRFKFIQNIRLPRVRVNDSLHLLDASVAKTKIGRTHFSVWFLATRKR